MLKLVRWENTYYWQEAYHLHKYIFACPYCGEWIKPKKPIAVCMSKQDRKDHAPVKTVHPCPSCGYHFLRPVKTP